jgi:hypothetical protein
LLNFLLEIGKPSIFWKLLNFMGPLFLRAHFPYKVHPLSHFPYKAQLTSLNSIILFLLIKSPQIHPSSYFCQEVVDIISLLVFIHCLTSPRNGSENNFSLWAHPLDNIARFSFIVQLSTKYEGIVQKLEI